MDYFKESLLLHKSLKGKIRNPTFDNIIPPTLDEQVAWRVADAVRAAAEKEDWTKF